MIGPFPFDLWPIDPMPVPPLELPMYSTGWWRWVSADTLKGRAR